MRCLRQPGSGCASCRFGWGSVAGRRPRPAERQGSPSDSRSAKSFNRPLARLFRTNADRPMNGTSTPSKSSSTRSSQASAKVTPETPVRMSIRKGGKPHRATMSGRIKSSGRICSVSSGAPNAAMAVHTRLAFSIDGSSIRQDLRLPAARHVRCARALQRPRSVRQRGSSLGENHENLRSRRSNHRFAQPVVRRTSLASSLVNTPATAVVYESTSWHSVSRRAGFDPLRNLRRETRSPPDYRAVLIEMSCRVEYRPSAKSTCFRSEKLKTALGIQPGSR